MDENLFFRQATLRICGSLNIQKATRETLEFIRQEIPADGLYWFVYEPDLHIGRNLVSIYPDSWPEPPEIIHFPEEMWDRMREDWFSAEAYGITNDFQEEEPVIQDVMKQMFPEDVSLIHCRLDLDATRIGDVAIAVSGKNQYTDRQAEKLMLLNEPFAIAMANYLQHQETVRLQEMLADDNRYLQQELLHHAGDTIIGADYGLKGAMEMVRQVASLESPVLLLGETGVGKEVLANAVHAASPRREGPFIKVNCGGLPESLLDSELFGHEKGAFTGAAATKRGRFERAHGGTIFLDEIGELPPEAQVKLLRVLQNREIERLGGTRVIDVDVRIISATHRNLEEMVAQGGFREDLWFRLNVFPIMIPPLRHRPQDVPALVDHFIGRKCREMKINQTLRVAPGDLERLKAHPWPGNVRELENLVERALIQNRGTGSPTLEFGHGILGPPAAARARPRTDEKIQPLDQAVANHIIQALDQAKGKVEGPGGAAQLLGLNPSTLRGKMRKLHIAFGRGG